MSTLTKSHKHQISAPCMVYEKFIYTYSNYRKKIALKKCHYLESDLVFIRRVPFNLAEPLTDRKALKTVLWTDRQTDGFSAVYNIYIFKSCIKYGIWLFNTCALLGTRDVTTFKYLGS